MIKRRAMRPGSWPLAPPSRHDCRPRCSHDYPGHTAWLAPRDAPTSAHPLYLVLDFGAHSASQKRQGREVCTLHPCEAAARGIGEGDILRLFNDRGALPRPALPRGCPVAALCSHLGSRRRTPAGQRLAELGGMTLACAARRDAMQNCYICLSPNHQKSWSAHWQLHSQLLEWKQASDTRPACPIWRSRCWHV